MATAQALYRFFGPTGDLLYVGITMDPASRWHQHRLDKPWWSLISTITVETHPTRKAVLDAERAAIQAERPRFNVTHGANGWDLHAAYRLPESVRTVPQHTMKCPACTRTTEPTRLTHVADGMFALYDCCRWTWQKTWPLTVDAA